ncbi:MAG TPA: maltose ABC transporter substrate-binding protein [Trueperaceae bacterium]|nr:maltose ABC transporter substrate-binding protein [Trueperaceae bacterium]
MKKLLVVLTIAFASTGVAFGQGLTVWTTFQDQSLDWLREQSASFTAGFGVDVSIVRLDVNELKQQALLSAPQGEAGDIFVGVPHDQIGELAVGGILSDMTSYATTAYLEDLSNQARLAYTVNGRLYGLPMFVEGPALVVNNDLVSEVPDTYEATMELAQELTTADTFGYMHEINNFYFSYAWLHTYGGYVFGRDASGSLVPTDVGLANEGAVAGAEALKDLRFDLGLIPGGTSFDVANGLFVDGALAMIYTGPWSISQYNEAGLDVGVVPVPPLADGTLFSGFMGVQGALVNEFSDMKVEAANFAKWLTRSDAQVSLARLSGRIPASLSALETVSDDPIIAGFGAALINAEPMPNIPAMGAVWAPMANALNVMTEDENSDVSALLNQAVDEILGR